MPIKYKHLCFNFAVLTSVDGSQAPLLFFAMERFYNLMARSTRSTCVLVFDIQCRNGGLLLTSASLTALATDTYTLKGDPNGETYQPRFTYHGFRFVQLSGYPGVPDESTLQVCYFSRMMEAS